MKVYLQTGHSSLSYKDSSVLVGVKLLEKATQRESEQLLLVSVKLLDTISLKGK